MNSLSPGADTRIRGVGVQDSMVQSAHNGDRPKGDRPRTARVLPRAPEELTRDRLARLGEGIGKVVYASEHWVVKRERRPSEVLALIGVWKMLRRLESLLPKWLRRHVTPDPGRRVQLLVMIFQPVILALPRGLWYATHIGEYFRWYAKSEARGAILADKYLAGTSLIPERVTFPPTRIRVREWPGWLIVSEASERVETTLHDRINDLARSLRFDEIQIWLDRFLATRRAGWERGVFSLDAHLKNFGVLGDRVVLLDLGGLTNRWTDIESRLKLLDDFLSPHARLGLELTLRDRPDIAQHFDEQWRASVCPEGVLRHWPAAARHQTVSAG
jgi:hypothetical protein